MKKMLQYLCMAALLVTAVANVAEAKGKPGSGGGGVSTNYGCATIKAGSTIYTLDGTQTKKLLVSTYACYLCNMTTRVCAFQSPASFVGWGFTLP
jgi:hypothetical protein